eukprot:TRINITY_DN351_c0_g3_i1.p1 TRINITY_DN351_c0_g3~~TRINITY_DN351_c0_g3_i1.p1  ORF type:complete len:854 (+),score=209.64 TRINITY_DN351_c0_g3_i1:936-3497(+)
MYFRGAGGDASDTGAYARPTMNTLRFGRNPDRVSQDEGDEEAEDDEANKGKKPTKFGTWDGVFARCLLNIFGVIMFLRLTWVVGHAGAGFATLIILASVCTTTCTALSLSAITSNGEVKGGGAYYLISRSLGPEFGGVIGILFSIASAIAVSMYIVGFAETIVSLMGDSTITSGGSWDIQVVSLLTLVVLFIIAIVGVSWVVKLDLIQLFLLFVVIIACFIGAFAGPERPGDGYFRFSSTLLKDNTSADYREGETFWSVLAVFFPAVTGVMAGANISGDLKDAQVNIPVGTLWAVLVSTIVYIGLAWMIAGTMARDVVDAAGVASASAGLFNDSLLMRHMAMVPAFVYIGVICATLSSALASLVGAPRVFQAVCKDNLFPFLRYFGRGHGASEEPYEAYVLTFVIAAIFLVVGDLNSIATLITNFFLISYAVVNYACFAADMSKSPGWRPTFKYYHKFIGLFGAFLCMALMVLIDYITTFITIAVAAAIYKYLDYKKPDVNWGSAQQAQIYVDAIRKCHKLDTTKTHVKTFRPAFLCLVGSPRDRPHLVRFANLISQSAVSLLIIGSVVLGRFRDKVKEVITQRDDDYLKDQGINGFSSVIAADSVRDGAQILMSSSGLGRLRPNTVLLGYKDDWETSTDDDDEHTPLPDYVSMIRDALDLHYGIMILRGTASLNIPTNNTTREAPASGTIDVWWLSDDGGLTVLVPYLMTQSRYWRNCKLRVLTRVDPNSEMTLTEEQTRMTKLLYKFRIAASEVVMLTLDTNPSEQARREYTDKFGIDLTEDMTTTLWYVRIGEELRKRSASSRSVFVTLPVPTDDIDPRLYMSWLSTLSYDLPPVTLIRGNQETVLTFYA